MAKAKNQFPAWAPPDVIEMWREETRTAAANSDAIAPSAIAAEHLKRSLCTPDLLYRILTDERMREVWRRIVAAGNFSGDIPHTTIFASLVINAWMGPWREERWTSAQRAAWLKEVSTLAERLAMKFRGTSANQMLCRMQFEACMREERSIFATARREDRALTAQESKRLERLHTLRYYSQDVFSLLRTLGAYAKNYLDEGVRGGQRQSLRAYFVRNVTRYYADTLGGPNSEQVAIITAVALEDDSITDRQVRRLNERTVISKKRKIAS